VYLLAMRKIELLSVRSKLKILCRWKVLTKIQLHGQTGQANTRADSPVATMNTSLPPDAALPATEPFDQTNKQARLPVGTIGTSPPKGAVMSTMEPHNRINTQAEPQVATTSTTPAADAVLSITELLEQILSHFDIKELILLRQVSRYWSDAMAESLVLQRAMFLEPEPELPFQWKLQRDPFDKRLRYIKQRSDTVSELDHEVFKSSRFNPLLSETRFDAGMDDTYCSIDSARLYPRHNLKDVCASKLFSRMLVAQPPVDHARVSCTTSLYNGNGIRVSDVGRVMEYEDENACGFGHVFSFVISQTMLPTKDEEIKGQILRRRNNLGKHCTDHYTDSGSRLVGITSDGQQLILRA
jgi:hypothetical protein